MGHPPNRLDRRVPGYRLGVADAADDADLRAVLAATPMGGLIGVTFRREPSYFGGSVVDGRCRQVIVAREAVRGRVVALGSRSIIERFVNGKPIPVGYLSNLRVLPEHRGSGLLARGYRFLGELHRDGRAAAYLTTIAQGNDAAVALLTSGRARLPAYRPIGIYNTFAIQPRRLAAGRSGGVSIRLACREDVPQILTLLGRLGPRRQFFPRYEPQDFFTLGGLLHGLRPEDLFLAFRGDRLAGMLGVWDQHAFRQHVINGYGTAVLRYARPLYNVCAGLLGRPRLPAPGHEVRCLFGALPIAEDAPAFAALLAEALRAAREQAAEYLLLGLAADDPLTATVGRLPARRYVTRVYLVCWPGGESLADDLDGRPLYLELGSL